MNQFKNPPFSHLSARARLTRILLSFCLVLAFAGCNRQINGSVSETTSAADSLNEGQILALMETRCFTCHNPDLEADTRLAPPMFMVRNHYYYDGLAEEKFVKQVMGFVKKPTERKSQMPGARRNFGLMPAQILPDAELKAIATYIFQNDLGSEEWYLKWEDYRTKKQP